MGRKFDIGDPIAETKARMDYIDRFEANKIKKKRNNVTIVTRNKGKKKTSQDGLPPGWTRGTIIMREEYLEKARTLAFKDKTSLKAIVDEALGEFFKTKKIKPLR